MRSMLTFLLCEYSPELHRRIPDQRRELFSSHLESHWDEMHEEAREETPTHGGVTASTACPRDLPSASRSMISAWYGRATCGSSSATSSTLPFELGCWSFSQS
eukprot:CAMPEP_0113237526 /NCGR_PEP_ID=MMETSP0008_2-20120614/4669_1 /TAXON_ID=97485 /ORGANISM="Prymnesium parvum" /LENGTH=102 /DNA_ID=CAMNT_0000084591 /DNA_START=598 /DNA_END=902 /DNA_ORIENTATION=+ /assembly_acc=CAM_ASM_000153